MDRIRRTIRCLGGCAVALALAVLTAPAAEANSLQGESDDLGEFSLEDLMQVEVTSVSKRAQKLSETPAAVYVLGNEEIRRSGVQTIPDALRLVPGMHVGNIDGNKWAVTARGFNNQFANKLLVMIDGRSVYTPLFSGTWWDVQDVVLEDVDRIEVIRGPGGSVWGANAVNGVINIITRSAKETQGLMITSSSGNIDRYSGAGRWGGTVNDDLAYRVYVKGFDRRAFESTVDGFDDANDQWYQVRGGFRSDWDVTGSDRITFQGDYYGGESGERDVTDPFGPGRLTDMQGGNALLRWSRDLGEGSELGVQAYYDRTDRDVERTFSEVRNTADVELRHTLPEWYRNRIIWGTGYRFSGDDIENTGVALDFQPTSRDTNLWSAFVQDEVNLWPGLMRLTAGSKFEHNDFTGFEYQPTARLLATPDEDHTLWLSGSRAVRTPSRVEDDLNLVFPTPLVTLLVQKNDDFRSEKVWAIEAGYRATPLSNLSIDLAGYYNIYDDLRTLEIVGAPALCPAPLPPGACAPGLWDNKMEARGYGTELVGNWRPTEYLQLTTVYTWMKVNTTLKDGSTDPTSAGTADSTPEHQVQLRSRIELPWNVQLDSNLFWVGKVPNETYFNGAGVDVVPVDDYFRLDLRLGWRPRPGVDVSFVGQNLTRASHVEFGNQQFSSASRIPRSFFGKVAWNY